MTGGDDGYFLDSTEVYDPSVGSWNTTGAKLPRAMSDLRAINIDERVLIFGILKILIYIKIKKSNLHKLAK